MILVDLFLEAWAPIMVSVSSGLPCLIAATRCNALDEPVVDRFLDQGRDGQVQTSPWLKANSTRPSMALSREGVVGRHDVFEEDVGRLAAQFQVAGIRLLAAAWPITCRWRWSR